MTTFLPVSRCHWAVTSSRAFFRLAAAKTKISRPCAAARSTPAWNATIAPTQAPSQDLLVDLIVVLLRRYISLNISLFIMSNSNWSIWMRRKQVQLFDAIARRSRKTRSLDVYYLYNSQPRLG